MRRKSSYLNSLKDLRLRREEHNCEDPQFESIKLLDGERKMKKKLPIGFGSSF